MDRWVDRWTGRKTDRQRIGGVDHHPREFGIWELAV